MDTARGFDDGRVGDGEGLRADGGGHDVLDAALASPPDDGGDIDGGGVDDAAFSLGGDERRMHVRAYNHWVSLLKGRPCPGIDDLDPANIADFGPHSVLIDFTRGIDDPTIAYLGRTLREECGLDAHVVRVADVPGRSLLSRLTDHYLQIIANRAPIGFEAEFVGIRGRTTLYRGILMPFTSDDSTIDFIYGVINWKELADADTQATLAAELDAAVRSAPRALAATPVWADGPSGGFETAEEPIAESATDASLRDRLAMARESAAAVRAADARGRAALYRALGRAHDFALACERDAEGYAALLSQAGLTVQPRAPLTAIVKLVFGSEYDKTRLAEYATVLAYARRTEVPAGGLTNVLETAQGGIKAVVAAERATRRPDERVDLFDRAAAELRALPVLGRVALPAVADEFVVLLARAGEDGLVDVIKCVDDKALLESVLRKAAA
ncbi:hypothetical protein [uncultured Sphingomonas sp.]|uniref:PAS domain-containing protein n=1 Tax=uncultured Sphingomonas sp. TaxID=158754 RepID=UPI0025D221D9|nr:hypothetical protein [uncultured Sphingomonas sp.]